MSEFGIFMALGNKRITESQSFRKRLFNILDISINTYQIINYYRIMCAIFGQVESNHYKKKGNCALIPIGEGRKFESTWKKQHLSRVLIKKRKFTYMKKESRWGF